MPIDDDKPQRMRAAKPQQDERPTLVEETFSGPEIEITLEMPSSKGELAEGSVNAPPATETVTPGRTAGGAEARRRMAGAAFSEAGAARAAELMANFPVGARDEMTDEQAAELVRRRAGVLDEVRPVHLVQERIDEVFLLGTPEPVPPKPPENLPAVIRRDIFAPDPDWTPPPVEINWLTIYDTPRYMQQFIRSFGRFVFRNFPCFAAHEEAARVAGEDPLGSIRLIANLGRNNTPSPQSDLDLACGWILKNGHIIESDEIEFPTVIPGYRPRIILAATETESFLLVDERATGMDNLYVYRWFGGRAYYLANEAATTRLEDLCLKRDPALAPPPRALPGPARRFIPQAAAMRLAVQRPIAEQDHAAVRGREYLALPSGERVPDPVETRAKLRALPVVAPILATNSVVDLLKGDGFKSFGTPTGPALRKPLGEGRAALVFGEPKTPLPASKLFRLEIEESGHRQVIASDLTDFEQIAEALTPLPGPRF